MKQLSNKEKSKRKLDKELKSLRNKLSITNLVWFESLSNEKKYDFLLSWKKEKFSKREMKTYKVVRKKISYFATRDFVIYPAKLKHFVNMNKLKNRYRTSKSSMRDSFLKILLEEK